MKITLSKNQWEIIGKHAGWIKAASLESEEAHKMFNDQGMAPPSHYYIPNNLIGARDENGKWHMQIVEDRDLGGVLSWRRESTGLDWQKLGSGSMDQMIELRKKIEST